jgi:hypothetical protein
VSLLEHHPLLPQSHWWVPLPWCSPTSEREKKILLHLTVSLIVPFPKQNKNYQNNCTCSELGGLNGPALVFQETISSYHNYHVNWLWWEKASALISRRGISFYLSLSFLFCMKCVKKGWSMFTNSSTIEGGVLGLNMNIKS